MQWSGLIVTSIDGYRNNQFEITEQRMTGNSKVALFQTLQIGIP